LSYSPLLSKVYQLIPECSTQKLRPNNPRIDLKPK